MIDFNFPVDISNGDTAEVLLIERKDGKEERRQSDRKRRHKMRRTREVGRRRQQQRQWCDETKQRAVE